MPAFKQVDSIEARIQGCVPCHGQSGQGTQGGVYPRIAGKPAGYLYNQLKLLRCIRQYNKDPKPLKWKFADSARRITSDSSDSVG